MNLTEKVKRAQVRAGIIVVKTTLNRKIPQGETLKNVEFILLNNSPEFVSIKINCESGYSATIKEKTENKIYSISDILKQAQDLFEELNFEKITGISGNIDFSENTFNLTAFGIKDGLSIKNTKTIL